jgi:hypothetical protein
MDFSTQQTNLDTVEIEMTSLICMVEDANMVLLTSCLDSAVLYFDMLMGLRLVQVCKDRVQFHTCSGIVQ